MKNKFSMKNLFENNRFLMVFSIVCAVLLYISVAMISNDVRTITITNVPVSIDLQAANLVNQRLTVIDDAKYYVDIEVTGPISVIGPLDADSPELLTTVRLNSVAQKGTYSLPIVSGNTQALTNAQFTIKAYHPSTIDIHFDRMESKTFEIMPKVSGLDFTPPPFIFEKAYTNPRTIRITGPESEISKIESCEVALNLNSTLESNFIKDLPIILKDAQGNIIDSVAEHLTLSDEEAQLVVVIHKETEIPLDVDFINIPRNFPIDQLKDGVTLSYDSLIVYGPSEMIDRMTELKLGYIDLKNLREDDSNQTFPVELPEGVKTRDNISSVTAKFDTSQWASTYFNISDTDIQLVSPPVDYDVELLSTKIEQVEFVGNELVLNSMSVSDIVAEVNLSDWALTSGQRSVPVKISVPGKGLVWAVGDYNVVIQIREKE